MASEEKAEEQAMEVEALQSILMEDMEGATKPRSKECSKEKLDENTKEPRQIEPPRSSADHAASRDPVRREHGDAANC